MSSIGWGLIMVAIGLFLFACGRTESQFPLYRLLVARSRLLWGDNVHRFYQVSGVLIAIVGLLVAAKLI